QELRQEAIRRLTGTKGGRALLTRALMEAASPESTWGLARALAPFASQFEHASGGLLKQVAAYLESDDRRADPLLFLLRGIDGKLLREWLEGRALAFRKKKKYEAALLYLRLIARDPACSEDIRFELAATGLKLSDHSLPVESRTGDPALQQFARLLRTPQIDP